MFTLSGNEGEKNKKKREYVDVFIFADIPGFQLGPFSNKGYSCKLQVAENFRQRDRILFREFTGAAEAYIYTPYPTDG